MDPLTQTGDVFYNGEIVHLFDVGSACASAGSGVVAGPVPPQIQLADGSRKVVAWADLSVPQVEIVLFTATPQAGRVGDAITVNWAVINASTTWINNKFCAESSGVLVLPISDNRDRWAQREPKMYLRLRTYNLAHAQERTLEIDVLPDPPKYAVESKREYHNDVQPAPQAQPHTCPDHPTVSDARYHAQQIEAEIDAFLSELRTAIRTSKEEKH